MVVSRDIAVSEFKHIILHITEKTILENFPAKKL